MPALFICQDLMLNAGFVRVLVCAAKCESIDRSITNPGRCLGLADVQPCHVLCDSRPLV